jgi:putative hydrolase of the HAD superfamily
MTSDGPFDTRDPYRFALITVDLDDTLWPCAPVIRAAEAALYAWLTEQTPRLAAAHDPLSLREHRRALMQMRPEIAHDVTALRRDALRGLMIEHDYPAGLAEHAMEVFRRARNRVEPYADVAPVLTQLRRRSRLVAVTNGNAEVQETPLRDAFDRVLTAAEAGAMRPDPALFELAMDWSGAEPWQTLHIGDDPVRDVEAAQRIGLTAVWINRDGLQWPPDLDPPAHSVTDLHGLLAWLDEPGPAAAASTGTPSGYTDAV